MDAFCKMFKVAITEENRTLKSINLFMSSLLLASTLVLGAQPAFSQGGADRTVFQEEQQMLEMDKGQLQQLEQEKQQYQQEVSQYDQQRTPYRLYAEQRVEQLSKLKAAGGSPSRALTQQKSGEYYALEKWLAADQQSRAEEQARMKQLDQSIANLQSAQTQTMQNLNSAIQSTREDSQQAADNQKFQQMMAINHFNELQSEMGAASWGRPPQDGTFNSTGGYGIGGGYGYGFGGWASGRLVNLYK